MSDEQLRLTLALMRAASRAVEAIHAHDAEALARHRRDADDARDKLRAYCATGQAALPLEDETC